MIDIDSLVCFNVDLEGTSQSSPFPRSTFLFFQVIVDTNQFRAILHKLDHLDSKTRVWIGLMVSGIGLFFSV